MGKGAFYAFSGMALAVTSEEPLGRPTTSTAILIPLTEGVSPMRWQLPRSSHLWQMVTFTPAGNVAGQTDVKEGLQGRLRRLTLGQLLATSRAFECSAVHPDGHDEALDVLLLHGLREADVAQAGAQLVEQHHRVLLALRFGRPVPARLGGAHQVQRVAQQAPVPVGRGEQLVVDGVVDGEVLAVRGGLELLEQSVWEVCLVGSEVRGGADAVPHGEVGLAGVGELNERLQG